MKISPVIESEAFGNVKTSYDDIKSSLHTPTLPIFFTYIGAFPDYLQYITKQLTKNLNDPQFIKLSEDLSEQIHSLIQSTISPSPETAEWLSRYQHTPSFYNFKKTNHELFITNLKLVMIFIALREAVKGWAIAAKKLPSSKTGVPPSTTQESQTKFVFEDIINVGTGLDLSLQPDEESSPDLIRTSPSILSAQQSHIPEKDLLRQYLLLCQSDFIDHMKKEEFLIMRLGMERLILASLDSFPNLVFSPINVVLNLTSKYPTFPELLYLLSEHFPTYSMQRMIFTGYMRQ
jgi:hypothetical protein